MNSLKTTHPLALRYLITEEMYALPNDAAPAVEEVRAVAQVDVVENESAYFEYLGGNNKYMLIIINETSHQNMQPKQLESLLSILNAKKLSMEDVAILNFYRYPDAKFTALKQFFACSSIVLFGINPAQVDINGVQANQISVHEQTKILATFSFDEMMADTDKKRSFWNEMKKL